MKGKGKVEGKGPKPKVPKVRQEKQVKSTLSEFIKNPYLILVFARLWFVFFGLGYIHPDAYFQSAEVTAGDVFGFNTERTWEFDPSNPSRTILTPAIITGLPFVFLKMISCVINFVNPFTLLYTPRLFLFFSSLFMDYTVWKLSGEEMTALLTFASSWIVFAIFLQPFSNTTETFLLCAVYLVAFKKSKNILHFTIIGILISIGFFNRFTFLFYVFPVVLYLLYEELTTKEKTGSSHWHNLLIGLTVGFTATSIFISFIDSVYYGYIAISLSGNNIRFLDLLKPDFFFTLLKNLGSLKFERFSWVITPVNLFIYNSKAENLVAHGTHWRFTHLIVNAPLLFGPLFITGLDPYYTWLDDQLAALTGQVTKKRTGGKRKIPKNVGNAANPLKNKETHPGERTFSAMRLTLLGSFISALFFLSLSTHQEMRFLSAGIIALVILGHKGIFGSDGNKWIKGSWIAFNVLLLLFMGVAHQGGVIPSLIKLSTQPVEADSTAHLFYFHTYMPPRHLLTQEKTTGSKPRFVIHDLKGSTVVELKKTISRQKESITFGPNDKIFVITPGTVDLEGFTSNLELIKKHWPHFSMEDVPIGIAGYQNNLSLNVYKWSDVTSGSGQENV